MLIKIEIELAGLSIPSQDELEKLGYDSQEDYWRDAIRMNPSPYLTRSVLTVEKD